LYWCESCKRANARPEHHAFDGIKQLKKTGENNPFNLI
jgi:hypothetical protein